jgi:type I restriction enzyme S subunit
MVGEWREVRLADIADITSGKRPPLIVEQAKVELTVPVLGGSGVMGFTSKPLFEEPVLVTGRVGTLGMLHRTSGPSWPSDNTLVVRAKEDLVVESFLYYALLDCIGQARSLNRGSSNPLVTQQDIGSLKLPLPPFPEQRAISPRWRVAGSAANRCPASPPTSTTSSPTAWWSRSWARFRRGGGWWNSSKS